MSLSAASALLFFSSLPRVAKGPVPAMLTILSASTGAYYGKTWYAIRNHWYGSLGSRFSNRAKCNVPPLRSHNPLSCPTYESAAAILLHTTYVGHFFAVNKTNCWVNSKDVNGHPCVSEAVRYRNISADKPFLDTLYSSWIPACRHIPYSKWMARNEGWCDKYFTHIVSIFN